MLKFMLEPAASFVGPFRPDKLNPAPLILAPKIFSSDVPVFDTLIVCVSTVLPVPLRKLAADGVRVTVPVPLLEPPTEPQPVSDSPAANMATGIARLRTHRRISKEKTTLIGTHKPPYIKFCWTLRLWGEGFVLEHWTQVQKRDRGLTCP